MATVFVKQMGCFVLDQFEAFFLGGGSFVPREMIQEAHREALDPWLSAGGSLAIQMRA